LVPSACSILLEGQINGNLQPSAAEGHPDDFQRRKVIFASSPNRFRMWSISISTGRRNLYERHSSPYPETTLTHLRTACLLRGKGCCVVGWGFSRAPFGALVFVASRSGRSKSYLPVKITIMGLATFLVGLGRLPPPSAYGADHF